MGSISSSSSPAAPTPFVPTLEVEVLPFLRGLAVLQMQMRTNAENVSFAFLSCKRREKGKRWGEEEEKVGLRGGRGNWGGCKTYFFTSPRRQSAHSSLIPPTFTPARSKASFLSFGPMTPRRRESSAFLVDESR